MFLLGNIGQQMDIEEVKTYLNRAIEEINRGDQVDADQNRQIARLEEKNRELQLYLLALVQLLARKQLVTETELTSLVSAVEQTTAPKS